MNYETEKELRNAGFKVITPGLTDILREIEEQGYSWKANKGKYGYNIDITGPGCLMAGFRNQPTIEEAAAQVLIWILERKKAAK